MSRVIGSLSYKSLIFSYNSFLPVGPGHGYDDRVLSLYFYYPGEYVGTSFMLTKCNYCIYNVVYYIFSQHYIHYDNVWIIFLLLQFKYSPVFDCSKTACLSDSSFSSLRIKLNMTRPGGSRRKHVIILCKAFWTWATTAICADRNRWPWKADSFSCIWL